MVDVIDLPPGFRFHPTDEEVITHYLSEKILNHGFTSAAIGEADLNKCEPWDLPSKAKMGEKEWFFFCQKDRKYPTGMRTNRATESGYWKATGKDKEIFRGKGVLVGMKKTLVFYKGRAPKGEKTNWVMHEFRIEGKPLSSNLPRSAKDEWVVNKVFNKSMGGIKKIPYGEGLMDSSAMAPLVDPNYSNSIGNGDFEALTSVASYYPPLMGTENSQFQSKGFIPNYNFQFPSPIPYSFPLTGAPADLGYFHAERAAFRPCKAEQFSNQSMISASQDTGLSTDPNTEISSVVSKHEIRYGDLDDPLSSAGQDLDLGNMWDY